MHLLSGINTALSRGPMGRTQQVQLFKYLKHLAPCLALNKYGPTWTQLLITGLDQVAPTLWTKISCVEIRETAGKIRDRSISDSQNGEAETQIEEGICPSSNHKLIDKLRLWLKSPLHARTLSANDVLPIQFYNPREQLETANRSST